MPGQCSPDDQEQVKAILMKVKEFTADPQNKVDLHNKIKECAKTIPLSPDYIETQEQLKMILGVISGITQEEIDAIVAAASGTPPPQASPPTGAGSAQPADVFEEGDRVKMIKEDNIYYNKEGTIVSIINDSDIKVNLDSIGPRTIKKEFLSKLSISSGGKRKSKKNKSKKSKSKKRRSKRRKHRKMRRTRR